MINWAEVGLPVELLVVEGKVRNGVCKQRRDGHHPRRTGSSRRKGHARLQIFLEATRGPDVSDDENAKASPCGGRRQGGRRARLSQTTSSIPQGGRLVM